MSLVIQGSLPASLAASILLLTKARRFGFRLNVAIVRQNVVRFAPKVVLFRDPLLVGLGVSSSDLDPSIVLTKGGCNEPLWVRVGNQWISIDRSGRGLKPETQELIRLFQSYDREKMHIAQSIRFAARKLGVELEPSIIDLFFQSATLEQGLLLILQIGRTLSGSSGDSISESLFQSSGEIQTKIFSRLFALQDAFAKVGCHALSDWMKQHMSSLKELRPQILMMSLPPDI
ncbi:MAG: hypothetical protein VX278_23690, partial [Myxococcota bacterium]|nr:hypothetical protein [Myxococcota bacterium]